LSTPLLSTTLELRRARSERASAAHAAVRARRQFAKGELAHEQLEAAVRRHAIAEARLAELTIVEHSLRRRRRRDHDGRR